MAHSIGQSMLKRVFGVRIVCTQHSAVRRYYMVRNTLEVCRRNLLFDPLWSCKTLLQIVSGGLAAMMFETDKLTKLQAMLRGAFDFARRRFGPMA